MTRSPGRLWGRQHPFERNLLQRTPALLGLGGVLAVTLILLVAADGSGGLGVALIAAGLVSALAALSRLRYVQETRLGFSVLNTRGGGFVSGSALAFAVCAVCVAVLILLP